MTALSADTIRTRDYDADATIRYFGVKAAAVVYVGAAVCLEQADGYARPVAGSLTNPVFLGFALQAVTNGGSSGSVSVAVDVEGSIWVSAITGAAGVADIGKVVYMSDDGSGFTLTSTNNVPMGRIGNFVGSKFLIEYQGGPVRDAT